MGALENTAAYDAALADARSRQANLAPADMMPGGRVIQPPPTRLQDYRALPAPTPALAPGDSGIDGVQTMPLPAPGARPANVDAPIYIGPSGRSNSGAMPGRSTGPGGVLVKPDAVPAPAVPGAPAFAGPTDVAATGGDFTSVKTTNPNSPFDTQIKIEHDIARMAGMAGLSEPAMKHMRNWVGLTDNRIQHLADDAIRGVATGNIEPAIALHNHAVPNGVQIVGYKQVPGGYQFQYDNGKVENAGNSQIAMMLAQYKDPTYLKQLGLATATKTAALQGDLMKIDRTAEQARVTEGQKAVHAKELESFKKQLGDGDIKAISRPTAPGDTDGLIIRTTKGVFHQVPGLPGKDGKPAMQWAPMDIGTAQRTISTRGGEESPDTVKAAAGAPAWNWGAS